MENQDKVFGNKTSITSNEEIEKSYMAQVLNTAAITGDTDQIEKAFNNIIEKGKKANVGEIREWAGGKFRKEPDGWKPVQMGKVKEVKEERYYTDKNLEDLVKKESVDERHFEMMPDSELKYLHDFTNDNLFNGGLNEGTKKRVREWWKASLSEISRRKKNGNS